MERSLRGFASDNNAGVHPEILRAIEAANAGHAIAYGDDEWTERARVKFQKHFGTRDVFFVFGGTPANVLGLRACMQPHHAVIAAECAHINVDECGALENFIGCKILTIPSADGKISVEQVARFLHFHGDEHRVQPKVISITQPTEYGVLYTPDEIKELANFACLHGMFLQMDGARLANAVMSLGVSLRGATGGAGVDVLSFGGTKNGMMYGDAVIFFNEALAKDFKFIRKQGMQLASKMRFIAAQFEALLTDDLWKRNAARANAAARRLVDGLVHLPGVIITQPVQTNAVFATMPESFIPILQERYSFYVWNEEAREVRLMTAFDTTNSDVDEFIAYARQASFR